jgi:hypothetical protein
VSFIDSYGQRLKSAEKLAFQAKHWNAGGSPAALAKHDKICGVRASCPLHFQSITRFLECGQDAPLHFQNTTRFWNAGEPPALHFQSTIKYWKAGKPPALYSKIHIPFSFSSLDLPHTPSQTIERKLRYKIPRIIVTI